MALLHLAPIATLLLAAARSASAAEPQLAIETTGGVVRHPVSGIQAIEFAGDTLQVVPREGAPHAVPLADILRVWFDAEGGAVGAPEVLRQAVDVLRLLPSRPNPASFSATIPFELPSGGPVHLAVFDVRGALVRTLVDGPRGPGAQAAVWDGRDDAGRRVASGMYFCRLRAAGVEDSRRIVWLR
ncbi:MAG: FlgD immunoglobulin-like domain containing protein [bacterium]